MGQINSEPFGVTKAGEAVTRWTLSNAAGMEIRVISYGCTVQSILVPDAKGNKVDVVLGYDDIAGYEQGTCFFGCFVGRYANRIKGAAFELDGKRYTLEKTTGKIICTASICARFSTAPWRGTRWCSAASAPTAKRAFPAR